MPNINTRMATIDSVYQHTPVQQVSISPANVSDNSSALQMISTNRNMMSPNGGNSVPMRGVLPVE